MTQLSPRVIKPDAPIINRPVRTCEALHCLCENGVIPVAGPGGVPLKLCPDHRAKLLGGGAHA